MLVLVLVLVLVLLVELGLVEAQDLLAVHQHVVQHLSPAPHGATDSNARWHQLHACTQATSTCPRLHTTRCAHLNASSSSRSVFLAFLAFFLSSLSLLSLSLESLSLGAALSA
jgi:hypothetical protein